MTTEQKKLPRMFGQLMDAPRRKFPRAHERLDAPTDRGVYVIYDPRGRPVHVGGTPRARNGMAQRLRDHLAGRSSFVIKHLKEKPSRLRRGYEFQCLAVCDSRLRALLVCHRATLPSAYRSRFGVASSSTSAHKSRLAHKTGSLPFFNALCYAKDTCIIPKIW